MRGRAVSSFLYPLRRGGAGTRWLVGVVLVAVLPASFVLVFGYAVRCIRAAAGDPAAPPPAWRLDGRLLSDGMLAALQAALLTVPAGAGVWLLAGLLSRLWHPTGDAFVDTGLAWILALTTGGLAWGPLLLVVVPPTLARFAVTGRPLDLAALDGVVACGRGRFADWNLALVTITTAWVLGAATVALGGVGVIAGVFYAILVSSHACATLAPDRPAR